MVCYLDNLVSRLRGFIGLVSITAVALCGALAPTSTHANPIDPTLVQALYQATRDVKQQTTDLDALLWLSSMSERLESRIKDPFYRIRLLKSINTEAELAGLDPQLVLAVIDIESNFNRYALSHAGAQGLMQVMPFWKDVYEQPNADLYNPLVSLRYGCKILRHYMDRHENAANALAAYNGSLGRATYSDKVLKRLASKWQFKTDAYSKNSDKNVAQR